MASEEDQRFVEIRNDRLRRLQLLEKRRALQGINTPPEILIEIEQTRRELGFVESVVSSPLSPSAVEEAGHGAQYVALDYKLDQIERRITARIDARIDRVEEHSAQQFDDEQAEHRDAQRWHRALFILVFIVQTFLAIGIAVIVTLLIARGIPG